ncbi:hypothetical protein [Psychromonas sp. MME2]|uniref:hypothetical protein n=1 Tax=unclassified Psychromonas TaxID=2614957 RepID=UPI00339C6432
MQISDWISLGSSLGALVAATIALITLFEIIKQRKSSFKPDLIVLNSNFRISYQDVENQFPTSWDTKQDGEEHSLSIVNIGLGVAKAIKIKWCYEHEKLLDMVISSSPKSRDIHNQIIQDGAELFLIFQDGKFKLPISYGLDKEFDYLIPISQMETVNTIQIPKAYEALMSLLVSHRVSIDDHPLDESLPSLKLEITYKDAGEYKHYKAFELKPKFISSMREDIIGISAFDFEFSLNRT